jgi:putative DNA primase/helicase
MRNDIDRIREALQFIPVGGNRERWRVAAMIHSDVGDAGRELWDEWRAGRGDDDALSTWRSASKDGALKIGSLFHDAKAGGWRDEGGYQRPTPEEVVDRKRKAAEREAQEKADVARERAEAGKIAAAILKAASEAKADHPYLARKRVPPVPTLREIDAAEAARILGYAPKSNGEPLTGRLLVAPIKQADRLSTVELIDGDGRKAALRGRGTKAGGYWATERLPDGDGAGMTLHIGEGVATVLTASTVTGQAGIAALSAGNLRAVAEAMREWYPAAELVILADLLKASGDADASAVEAARAVGGRVAVPGFGGDRDPTWTDFNDLAAERGTEAVGRAIEAARAPVGGGGSAVGKGAPEAATGAWREPQPLAEKIEPEPYPVDALPDAIRAAVEEVAGFVKAPVPMVASCALASLSVAAQAHADVQRAEKLKRPVGLYLLTIADSGERKSTCDGFFSRAIREWDAAQAEAAKPAQTAYRAAIEAWEARRSGIKDAIRSAAKRQKSTASLQTELRDLEQEKPEAPRVPRLLYGDATPESLAYGLARQWPCGGVLSAEAGIVFGGHAMGRESVMRNLALLNVLWDGDPLTVDRRTSESFTIRGARLTVALQVQEPTLREFFTRSGALARGSGFLARFLIAWPESTQGRRPFTEAPDKWPALSAFNQRIAALLEHPAPVDGGGGLCPTALSLTPEAKAAWVEYHDTIERELASGGELYDVRDVASKSADNAVRLAALFQMFSGTVGAVGIEAFESAAPIAAWHLYEARRFFGELALPAEMADATRLDGWLIETCNRERCTAVPTREAQRLGPVREKMRLEAALRELTELDRVLVVQDGRRKLIEVNPRLVGVSQ